MHYITLSRVTSLSGLYLQELNSDKICISHHVAKYLENARQNSSVKLSYRPTYLYGDANIKVVYNNTRSYRKHYYDIKDNYNILAADIIFLAETRFTLYDKTELSHRKLPCILDGSRMCLKTMSWSNYVHTQ